MEYICSDCADEDLSSGIKVYPHVHCSICGQRTICKEKK